MNKPENLLKLFKNTTGDILVPKPGQIEIFDTIVQKKHKRLAIACHTRYGKSLTVALAALVRAIYFPESWCIIAPTKDKTDIIMRQIIQHLFDNKRHFISQLEIDYALERLKRERKKDHLSFRRGGQIFTLTADSKNQKRIGGALLGEGAGNVILDESPLISDKTFSFVLRMLGDTADNFLVQIGNTFERNHFKRAFDDPRYHKIVIDCYQGLKESEILPYGEGKLTQEFLEENKDEPFFEQLWECKFPEQDMVDDRGYTALVSEDLVAKKRSKKVEPKGKWKLGLDVGRGGDSSVFVARCDNYAYVLEKNQIRDIMQQSKKIAEYKEKLKIEYAGDIFVDGIGIGAGVVDRCYEMDIPVTSVIAGGTELLREPEKFKNIKAEGYWYCKKWLEADSTAIDDRKEWTTELTEIRYKEDSERKLKIEPKDEFRRRMGFSPDTVEALMTTFAPQETQPSVDFI